MANLLRYVTGLLLALLGLGAGEAQALNLTELYTTQAIVTGTGEANRKPGLEQCFREVLVKVSGDQSVLRDERLASLLPQAGSLLTSFRYRDRMEDRPIHDEQGTHDRPHDLTCVFDRERVDRVLDSLGRKPWRAERPRLVVFLSVKQAGKAFVLARNGADGSYMRQSLVQAAESLGLPVELPDGATLSSAALNAATLPKVEMEDLETIAARYDGAKALAGSLVWSDQERGWIAHWRLDGIDNIYEWQVRGVGFDQAFRNAMAGSLQVLSGNGQP